MADAWKSGAEKIDRCKWLWLDDIEVTQGYGLRIRVEESMLKRQYEDLDRDFTPELAARIRAENPDCEVQKKGPTFGIMFREVISYTVTNETYGRYPEAPEVFTGKLFRIFSWSYLLELTRKTTYAADDHPGPGPLQHYQVACQDDVVDVIACVEPIIVAL